MLILWNINTNIQHLLPSFQFRGTRLTAPPNREQGRNPITRFQGYAVLHNYEMRGKKACETDHQDSTCARVPESTVIFSSRGD